MHYLMLGDFTAALLLRQWLPEESVWAPVPFPTDASVVVIHRVARDADPHLVRLNRGRFKDVTLEAAFQKSDAFSLGKMMFDLLLCKEEDGGGGAGCPGFPRLDKGRQHYLDSEVCFPVPNHGLRMQSL
jgi:hypothetical protein